VRGFDPSADSNEHRQRLSLYPPPTFAGRILPIRVGLALPMGICRGKRMAHE
jgi:hypothetical protein